ncbi:hypothetical protein CRG98_037260 [Punica granatum]|uniref:Uncharacterized protein n=1 Tax=Punica granatum TaxID=22663 RepID=A0A2I0IED0_PUNGR|nr:hypothetical protein CRG98_037260 [Punica granatum]
MSEGRLTNPPIFSVQFTPASPLDFSAVLARCLCAFASPPPPYPKKKEKEEEELRSFHPGVGIVLVSRSGMMSAAPRTSHETLARTIIVFESSRKPQVVGSPDPKLANTVLELGEGVGPQ